MKLFFGLVKLGESQLGVVFKRWAPGPKGLGITDIDGTGHGKCSAANKSTILLITCEEVL